MLHGQRHVETTALQHSLGQPYGQLPNEQPANGIPGHPLFLKHGAQGLKSFGAGIDIGVHKMDALDSILVFQHPKFITDAFNGPGAPTPQQFFP